ncbi:uncharacterized protein [Palaemon carinicauda]|uniref:uncharacterized protein n=1 Tax=Palaemon carinicauda TaxID=392227 RepID=UPI0035B60591
MAAANFIPLLEPRQSGAQSSPTTHLMGCEIEDAEESGMTKAIMSALPVAAVCVIGVLVVLLVVYLTLKLKEMRLNLVQMDKVLLGHTQLIFPPPNLYRSMKSEKTCSTKSLINPTAQE